MTIQEAAQDADRCSPLTDGTALAVARGTLRLSHRGSDTQFELPLAIDANGIGETEWTAPAGAPLVVGADVNEPAGAPAHSRRRRFSSRS